MTYHLGGETAIVLKACRHIGNVVFRFHNRFAVVARFEFSQHRGILPDFLRQLK